ncbi:hypothetical protein GLGCALEP_00347 [Pseudomonas sp. MM221]|nr:hypothetical protein GLGCALEP_00347 [Pseudomonas sp. MM221]
MAISVFDLFKIGVGPSSPTPSAPCVLAPCSFRACANAASWNV